MLPLPGVLGSNLATDPGGDSRRLLRLPSRQHERKRSIQSRTTSRTMTCLPTIKAHKPTPITSERSLSRVWCRRCLTRKQQSEQGFQPRRFRRRHRGRLSNLCLGHQMLQQLLHHSGTGAGTGIGVVTPTSKCRSNSSI